MTIKLSIWLNSTLVHGIHISGKHVNFDAREEIFGCLKSLRISASPEHKKKALKSEKKCATPNEIVNDFFSLFCSCSGMDTNFN